MSIILFEVIIVLETVSRTNVVDSIRAIDNNTCNRCLGNNIKTDYDNIDYCLDCYQLREISSTLFLIRRERTIQQKNHTLKVDFPLSNLQNQGSEFLVNCFNERKNAFLHAVCGAGKTEMALELIYLCLQRNLRVAFVIPRVEIIKQVGYRFMSYFPKTSIGMLYGGTPLEESNHLIITTPQQLIKFYQEFDLLIIDEVDAFPFVNNPFLERLVKKASKDSAITIYMSATISNNYLKMIKEKKIDYFLVPKRFHQRSLALPIFRKAESFFNSDIQKDISSMTKDEMQLIIYLKSIMRQEFLYSILKDLKLSVDLISSKTKYKKQVIMNFERQETKILLATTILERGVTFKNVNVLVLEADDPIFTEATLMQICGRVGRVSDYGLVVFYGKYLTKAMINARKDIDRYNEL